MKKMNKVIATMMMMAITTAMPAMAGNKNYGYHNNDKKVVVVTNNKKASHFDKFDKKTTRFNKHNKHAYRADLKSCTFKMTRHDVRHHAIDKIERIHGVMNAYWNPRTREMTVIYDARKTSPRRILHAVA